MPFDNYICSGEEIGVYWVGLFDGETRLDVKLWFGDS